MSKKYRAAALFSGIGGFCLGFGRANISTAWAIENDDYAATTYRRNLQEAKLIERNGKPSDIREISTSSHQLAAMDVFHAGFPCQSFSQAGNRKGFDDDRGQLFFEVVRILRELGEDRPKIVVLENSPNLKYGKSGQWFHTVASSLRRAGYWFRESNCAELDLYDHSASPQQRNRLFMVALATNRFKNGRFLFPRASQHVAPKNLEHFIDFQGEKDDSYYLPEQNRYYRMIASKAKDKQRIYQLRKYTVRVKDRGVCPTLTANMGRGGHNVPFVFDAKGLRKLTERECLALQGFPKDFEFPDDVPNHARYTQIGNSVSPLVAHCIAQNVSEKLEDAIQYV
ncbi:MULTISPECIES: DNA cytosine methyltransferase [unclassified Wenzhouxiangella]|uniref:DNA cytosine methyltransferase n=1 Tax=unclassified Wenzhouxiangella TaxID=2613841 RepID=UPI000E3295DF|nr:MULTISPECIES: DNA (cytosine-5-)-methyltransferase [unclassified Wenzhouxiangella]RFF26710.1 DNA (cytosine-5-)-methyltransferase [Wenzhouxiangella sp. 15181]RFP69321.1 DNA (cytosine-5-)-methyltransferase [Wenzhouxiangella sp. 15190]